jgi:hypothetical protein
VPDTNHVTQESRHEYRRGDLSSAELAQRVAGLDQHCDSALELSAYERLRVRAADARRDAILGANENDSRLDAVRRRCRVASDSPMPSTFSASFISGAAWYEIYCTCD